MYTHHNKLFCCRLLRTWRLDTNTCEHASMLLDGGLVVPVDILQVVFGGAFVVVAIRTSRHGRM